MTLEQAFQQLDKLNANLQKQAMQIIAEKATAYYKRSFTVKSWEGIPWQPAKNVHQRGTLMVRSAKLLNSIRPVLVTQSRVVIRAGSPQVPYARIHNEGGIIAHPGGTPYFFNKKTGQTIWVSKKNAGKLPVTRPHKITIPQRQYMGRGPILDAYLIQQLRTNKLIK